MIKDLKSIISNIIQEEHSWKITLLKRWASIIGPLHNFISIEKIDETTLFLAVTHPTWAQEVQSLVPTLLLKINSQVQGHSIKQIKCAYRHQRPTKKMSHNHNPAAPPLVLQPLSAQEKQLLATMHSPQLESAFAAYLVRCKSLKGRA
ncbi:DUF721 domain-containing protein [Candidatus Dependentiae bacterium]|nr:DUF721 domain-containing protein [Candidatus Dependentiae bacterium]